MRPRYGKLGGYISTIIFILVPSFASQIQDARALKGDRPSDLLNYFNFQICLRFTIKFVSFIPTRQFYKR